MKKDNKQRLYEMMGKLDPSFKGKLNESLNETTWDELKNRTHQTDEPAYIQFDIEDDEEFEVFIDYDIIDDDGGFEVVDIIDAKTKESVWDKFYDDENNKFYTDNIERILDDNVLDDQRKKGEKHLDSLSYLADLHRRERMDESKLNEQQNGNETDEWYPWGDELLSIKNNTTFTKEDLSKILNTLFHHVSNACHHRLHDMIKYFNLELK